MRKIKTKILTTSLLLLMITAIFSGCKKAEIPGEDLKVNAKSNVPIEIDPEPPGDPIPSGPSIEELKSFFAWAIQVPSQEIAYDASTNEFYIQNTFVREPVQRIQNEYEKANVYQLTLQSQQL